MSKKYILVVEDDDDLRPNLTQELSELTEFTVIEAKDGVQAYQKARNQKFEVILAEFEIKKLDGGQLVAAVRETNHNINTPVIIHTKDVEAAKNKTRGQDGVFFLTKPTPFKDIATKILEMKPLDATKKKFKLDVDFINPFIDSAMSTLNSLCGVNNIKAEKPFLFENQDLNVDISGVLAITSPYFRGSIAITFNADVYKVVVGKMIEENVESISIDNEDGVAEIINIIFGQTKAVLNQKGYSLQRAIPHVTKGHNHKILNDSKIPILLVPFKSELGDFWIQICVKAI